MKRLILGLVALSLTASAMAAVKTVRFSVAGWTCGSCAAASRIALRKLEGVEEVTTDAKKGEAVVRYDDGKVTPEQMAAALKRLGYVAAVRTDGSAGSAARAAANGPVTFFEVPLGCPAVEKLGCGSLAMPILAELERDPRVEQAWLDHEGTVLAVVWKGNPPTGGGLRDVEGAFRKSGLDAALLTGPSEASARKSFATRDRWYRGEDVANLSREEARVLAAKLVKPVERELGPRAAALRDEFTAALERCFLGSAPLVREDFAKIALKYVDEKGIAKMEAAWDGCGLEELEER